MSETTTQEVAQDTTNATEETVLSAEAAETTAADSAQESVAGAKTETTEVTAEQVQLKLPDDSPLDQQAVERIAQAAKERGLTQQQAQAILEHESKVVSEFRKAQEDTLKQQSVQWRSELSSDKEFGGEAFGKNAEIAKRVVQKFGSEKFVGILEETGLGNHPELVKLFWRIGKAFSEDSMVKPNAQGATNKDLADVFYGSTKNN